MALKDIILQTLETHSDSYISGQQIADETGVSRTAIWKAINALRNEGYTITSVTNKGYQLAPGNNIISAEGISPFLISELSNANIIVHKTIGSTNAEAKQLALSGSPQFTVVISEEQTNGRGRLGRSFYSPSGSGIYMSIILKPEMDIESATLITTATSVAVCKGIEETTKASPSIKWINDIYINDRKICGILTEAISNFETGMIESIILGIGINVSTKINDFPDNIKDTAGSISDMENISRNRLIANILNNFYSIYTKLEPGSYIDDYKSRSMLINKPIYYIKNDTKYYATAIDITPTGGLMVKKDDNSIETLTSGEVSVRIIK